MNYRSCEAIHNNFIVTEGGDVACPASQMLVENSLQRAYVFASLFFYDITQREVGKLSAKINRKRETISASAGMPADAVEQVYPALSAQFKMEIGDNSLDPLIKVELGKIKTHLSLQPSKAELKALDAMYEAICTSEIQKFKKAVIFTHPNGDKPYKVTFAEKYINNLPARAKRLLKPTIKMLAYMDGLQFDQFDLAPDYELTYTWADVKPVFDETAVKDALKSVIAHRPDDVV